MSSRKTVLLSSKKLKRNVCEPVQVNVLSSDSDDEHCLVSDKLCTKVSKSDSLLQKKNEIHLGIQGPKNSSVHLEETQSYHNKTCASKIQLSSRSLMKKCFQSDSKIDSEDSKKSNEDQTKTGKLNSDCKISRSINIHSKTNPSLENVQNSTQLYPIPSNGNEKITFPFYGNKNRLLPKQDMWESRLEEIGAAAVNLRDNSEVLCASSSHRKIVYQKNIDSTLTSQDDPSSASVNKFVDMRDQSLNSKRKRQSPVHDVFDGRVCKTLKKNKSSLQNEQSLQCESLCKVTLSCGQSNRTFDNKNHAKDGNTSCTQLDSSAGDPDIPCMLRDGKGFEVISSQNMNSVSTSGLGFNPLSFKEKSNEIKTSCRSKSSSVASFTPTLAVGLKQFTSEFVQQFTKHPALGTKLLMNQEENDMKNDVPEDAACVKLKKNFHAVIKDKESANLESKAGTSSTEVTPQQLQKKTSHGSISERAKSAHQPHAQKQGHYYNMSGMLVALSHTFQMSTCKMYLAQFYLDRDCPHPLQKYQNGGTHKGGPVVTDRQNIIVMVLLHHKLASWRAQLKFGAWYSICRAKAAMVLKNATRIAVLKVYPNSTLTRLDPKPLSTSLASSAKNFCLEEQTEATCGSDASSQASSVAKFLQDEGWFTYQGVVNKVINSNLGLYELDDGRAILVLSYLVGFVDEAKYWSSSCEGVEENAGGLAVGCSVVVQRPHIAKLLSGTLLITCCGRSLVTTKAKKQQRASTEVVSAALDAVLHYSFHGFHSLLWLADLEQQVCGLLELLGVPPRVVTRHELRDGRPTSPLSRLLQGWHDKVAPGLVARSFVKEFCAPKHALCVATRGLAQKFVAPFEIFDAVAVEDKEREKLDSYDGNQCESFGTSSVVYWKAIVTPLRLSPANDSRATTAEKSTLKKDPETSSRFKNTSRAAMEETKIRTEKWTTESVILCRLEVTGDGELKAVLQDECPKAKNYGVNSDNLSDIRDISSMEKCRNEWENRQSPVGLRHHSQVKLGLNGPSLQSTADPIVQESDLQLAPRTSYPLEVVGTKSHIDSTLAKKIVALFNPILVTEVFHIYTDPTRNTSGHRTVYKRYLMIDENDIVKIYDAVEDQEQNSTDGTVIQSNSGQKCLVGVAKDSSSVLASSKVTEGCKKETEFLIKISGKLNRMVLVRAAQREAFKEDLMFLCRATVTQKNKYRFENVLPLGKFHPVSNPKDRKQRVYLRFKGPQQLSLFCSLSDVCEMRASVPSASASFTKSTAYWWLPPLTANDVKEAECIDVPESAIISVVSHTYIRDEISVSDVCSGNFLRGCLLTVVGLVKERFHMTSAYQSQKMELPEACDMLDIGVPGCKLIRLLLEDDCIDNNDASVRQLCVYISLKTNQLLGKYPRGLIEGSRVKICGVSVNKSSKTKTTYINAQPWSRIQILTLPSLSSSGCDGDYGEGQKNEASFKFLHEINKEFTSTILNRHSQLNPTACSLVEPRCGSDLQSNEVHPILRKIPAGLNVIQIQECYSTRLSCRVARVLASVTRLLKLSLSFQCSDCNSEMSASGSCSYVGCFSNREPVLTAFARLVIEDGSSQAYVIVKNEEHVQTLLAIPNSKWRKIISTLTQLRLPLTYLPKTKSKFGYVDPESLISDEHCQDRCVVLQVCTQIIHNYMSTGALFRPLLLNLRPLKPSLDYAAHWKGVISCYCLHLCDIIPENHLKLLDR